MERKKTPNIMGELLTGKQAQQKTTKEEHHNTITPVYHNSGTQEKATFYLDKGVLDQLEKRWLELRGEGQKTSKSKMVELALRSYFEGGPNFE